MSDKEDETIEEEETSTEVEDDSSTEEEPEAESATDSDDEPAQGEPEPEAEVDSDPEEESEEEEEEDQASHDGLEQFYPSVPEIPDPPSYAPIVTGLGIALVAWGFLTNMVILFFGVSIFSLAISIWIKELTTHEL